MRQNIVKIICKKNTAKGFDLKEVTTLFNDQYRYELILEKEYYVMGMAIYKSSCCLYYLIDENDRPNWYPYLLFSISDNSMPNDWYIWMGTQNPESDIYYLAGFNELCNSENFYDLLIERDKQTLETYFLRKNEIYPI